MSDLRLMSRDFLADFINLYRENPCLWKVKSKEYSDKHKKNAAYEILIEKLKEIDPAANKDAVIKRINSLRTFFRKELKKTRSQQSGMGTEDLYKPNLSYFNLLMFLTDQETPRQDGMDTINKESSVVDVSTNLFTLMDDSNFTEDENNSNDHLSSETAISTTPSTSSSISKMSVKRKSQKNLDRSDEVLNIVASKLQNQGKYAAFGQHVGQELQELPSEMAIYCKKVINEALYQAQIGKLNETSKIVTQIITDKTPSHDVHSFQDMQVSRPSNSEFVRPTSTPETPVEPSQPLRVLNRRLDTFQYDQGVNSPIELKSEIISSLKATTVPAQSLAEYYSRYNVNIIN